MQRFALYQALVFFENYIHDWPANVVYVGRLLTRWSKRRSSLWRGTSSQSRNIFITNYKAVDWYLFCAYLAIREISKRRIVIHLWETMRKPWAIMAVDFSSSPIALLHSRYHLLQELWTCDHLSAVVGILLVCVGTPANRMATLRDYLSNVC